MFNLQCNISFLGHDFPYLHSPPQYCPPPLYRSLFRSPLTHSVRVLLELRCYRAQLRGQTREWLTDRGTSTCALRKCPPPQLELWLGLAWLSVQVLVCFRRTPASHTHISRGHRSRRTRLVTQRIVR